MRVAVLRCLEDPVYVDVDHISTYRNTDDKLVVRGAGMDISENIGALLHLSDILIFEAYTSTFSPENIL